MRRFTETDKWRDPWFRQIPYGTKLAYTFIVDNCDRAGVWTPDFELANFMVGYKIDWDGVKKSLGDRLVILDNGDWLIARFVAFQYGSLTHACPPHRSIIQLIVQKHLRNGYPLEHACLKEGLRTDPDPEQEPEPLEEAAPAPTRAQPVKRTVPKKGRATKEEVMVFAEVAGIEKSDAEWFFEKCEGQGWCVQGRPIIDWKATFRGWRAGKYLPSQKQKQKADEQQKRHSNSGSGANRNAGHNRPDYSVRPQKAAGGPTG